MLSPALVRELQAGQKGCRLHCLPKAHFIGKDPAEAWQIAIQICWSRANGPQSALRRS